MLAVCLETIYHLNRNDYYLKFSTTVLNS